jgi:hypothetical protein
MDEARSGESIIQARNSFSAGKNTFRQAFDHTRLMKITNRIHGKTDIALTRKGGTDY